MHLLRPCSAQLRSAVKCAMLPAWCNLENLVPTFLNFQCQNDNVKQKIKVRQRGRSKATYLTALHLEGSPTCWLHVRQHRTYLFFHLKATGCKRPGAKVLSINGGFLRSNFVFRTIGLGETRWRHYSLSQRIFPVDGPRLALFTTFPILYAKWYVKELSAPATFHCFMRPLRSWAAHPSIFNLLRQKTSCSKNGLVLWMVSCSSGDMPRKKLFFLFLQNITHWTDDFSRTWAHVQAERAFLGQRFWL